MGGRNQYIFFLFSHKVKNGHCFLVQGIVKEQKSLGKKEDKLLTSKYQMNSINSYTTNSHFSLVLNSISLYECAMLVFNQSLNF